jgi:hypothetical protein
MTYRLLQLALFLYTMLFVSSVYAQQQVHQTQQKTKTITYIREQVEEVQGASTSANVKLVEINNMMYDVLEGKKDPQMLCDQEEVQPDQAIGQLKLLTEASETKPAINGTLAKALVALPTICADKTISQNEMKKIQDMYR